MTHAFGYGFCAVGYDFFTLERGKGERYLMLKRLYGER